jgi:diguanylate cyclase (GGDEF)-like protein
MPPKGDTGPQTQAHSQIVAPPSAPSAAAAVPPTVRPTSPAALLVVAAVAALAVGAGSVLVAWLGDAGDERALGFLLPLVLILTLPQLDFAEDWGLHMLSAPLVAATLVLPAPFLVVCGAAVALGPLKGHNLRVEQRVFNACNHVLALLVAAAAARFAFDLHDPLRHGGEQLALAGAAATVVYTLVMTILLTAVVAADETVGSPSALWTPRVLVSELSLGAVGVAIAGLWHAAPVLVVFALVPVALIWQSLHVPRLREEARRDSKTGLYNERYLHEALLAEIARATRLHRSFAIVMLDLDHLRDVNNTHGHLVGDDVLRGVGDVLREELRSSDVPARFGGEEFCALLPDTGEDGAAAIAERIRAAVAGRSLETEAGFDVRATISLGVATFPDDGRDERALIRAADEAMYAAKAEGRNRVRIARAMRR